MSESRRTVKPIRQLSLPQPVLRRQQIRRQRSTEDEKTLRIHADSGACGRHGGSARSKLERPKARLAWSEQCHGNNNIEKVEIVARQISGKSKPTPKKTNKIFAGNDEKATILYSRQQLTERLRLAWKHREENKANIDIFLAHTGIEDRCESESSNNAANVEPLTPLSVNEIHESEKSQFYKLESQKNIVTSNSNNTVNEIVNVKKDGCVKTVVDMTQDTSEKYGSENIEIVEASFKTENTICTVKENTLLKDKNDISKTIAKMAVQENNNRKEENQQVEDSSIEDTMKPCVTEDYTSRDYKIIKFPSIKSDNVVNEANIIKIKNSLCSAKQKRAHFRNRENYAFLYPGQHQTTTRPTMTSGIQTFRCSSAIDKIAPTKKILETTSERSGFENIENITKATEIQNNDRKPRSNSAPLQRHSVSSSISRVQVNIVIDTPCTFTSQKKVIDGSHDKLKNDNKYVNSSKISETQFKVSCGRPLRSTLTKKRSKSCKRQFCSLGLSCKDEHCTAHRERSSASGKNATDAKFNEVITMVSLVSSADSDSDDQIIPDGDKLINELREKLPTTPIIKSSMSAIFNGAKKPVKTVSFQRDSFDENFAQSQSKTKEEKITSRPNYAVINNLGNTEKYHMNERTILWKINDANLPVPVVPVNRDKEGTSDVPLTDHEMRCLPVPIGNIHDKKRKLQRTRSTPSLSTVLEKQLEGRQHQLQGMIIPNELTTHQTKMDTKNSLLKDDSKSSVPSTEGDTSPVVVEKEPHFQTHKEKDCWHLYKRMCDKGVYVSFDTVLRGMLTPTEYRLRQKELPQNF